MKYYMMLIFLLPAFTACEGKNENVTPIKVQQEPEMVLNKNSQLLKQEPEKAAVEQLVTEQAVEKEAVSKEGKQVGQLLTAEKTLSNRAAASVDIEEVIPQEKDGISKPKVENKTEPLVVIQNAGDAVKGKAVAKKCRSCHTLEQGEKNKVGPNLFGIIGKKHGQAVGFKYGSYLKNSAGIWDETSLRAWIHDSKSVALANGAKSKMSAQKIRGAKADDLMAYLRTLK